MKRILTINLIGKYFDQIKSGEKKFEYRKNNDYLAKRIAGKKFDEIHIKKGYPKRGDMTRTLIRPWLGFSTDTITHPHFGSIATGVIAIRVNPE